MITDKTPSSTVLNLFQIPIWLKRFKKNKEARKSKLSLGLCLMRGVGHAASWTIMLHNVHLLQFFILFLSLMNTKLKLKNCHINSMIKSREEAFGGSIILLKIKLLLLIIFLLSLVNY